MSDKQSPLSGSGDTTIKPTAKPLKTAYSAPVLWVYGSVSKLTMGGAGTGVDGIFVTMML